MKRFLATAVGSFLAVALSVSAASAAPAKVVVGKLVNPKCKMTDSVCMANGARLGHPLVIMGKDGKLYVVTGTFAASKNAKLLTLVGKNVQATGNVAIAGAKRTIAATAVIQK